MKPMDFERDNRVLDFTRYALSTKKNNSDGWMVGFVTAANAMFKSRGENRRLRYRNDEIETLT